MDKGVTVSGHGAGAMQELKLKFDQAAATQLHQLLELSIGSYREFHIFKCLPIQIILDME